VRDHTQLQELEISLVENVQRVDLSPLEQAASVVRLRDQFSLTPKQISKKLGKAETTVSNLIRLLQLPARAIEALQKNEITEGHARAVLSLRKDPKEQEDLLTRIIADKLSVREAEARARGSTAYAAHKSSLSPQLQKVLNSVDKDLARAIKVSEKKPGSGTVTIKYDSYEQLKKMLTKIQK